MDYYKCKECIFVLDNILSVKCKFTYNVDNLEQFPHEDNKCLIIKYVNGEEVIIERLSESVSKLIYNHIYDYLMYKKSILDIIEELREFNKGTHKSEVI